jgi:hypothetical protein
MEILLAIVIGFGGGWFFSPVERVECKDDALIISSCPAPSPLTDPSFGGHILKLQEVAGQYRECRKSVIKE